MRQPAVRNAPWIEIMDDPPIPEAIQARDLGRGESAVLAFALAHPGAVPVLDDLAARRCAESLGLPIRGTVGLVIVAKMRGLLAAARPVVIRLREAGMHISEEALNSALKEVGE
jgi:predicted nucleic acid-binding protein